VDMLAGDAPAAEARLRRELDLLEAMGETYLRPTVAAYLAAAVANQGRYEEADRFAALAAELASEDDVTSQAMWRSVRARVLVREGRVDEAVELADGAVELLAGSDGIGQQADALLVLSEVLGRAGRRDAAERSLEEAIALYDLKGNVVAASAARAALDAGVDGLVHAAYVDASLATAMRARGMWLSPTIASLTAYDTITAARALVAAVRVAHDAGVTLVFGTDGGVLPHGRGVDEMEALVALGLTPLEVMQAATINAATALVIADSVGQIAVGMSADFIAVRGDPLRSVTALRDVGLVVSRGRIAVDATARR